MIVPSSRLAAFIQAKLSRSLTCERSFGRTTTMTPEATAGAAP
jgi:hypothetical protein